MNQKCYMNIFIKLIKELTDEKIYNFKGKNFSRILQDYENKLLMNLYDYFQIKKNKNDDVNI